MKCFVAVLFLVAVAVGDHCTPPEQYSAAYLAAGSVVDVGENVVSGKMMVDMTGNRLWETFDTGKAKGEVLLLYNENTMYVTTDGQCFKQKIPEQQKNTLEEMKLPKDAVLLQTGDIADSNVKVNVYGGQVEKEGHTVQYIVSLTDESCVTVSITYKVDKVMMGQGNLFDVKLKIDEEKFDVPKDCHEIPPQTRASAPSYMFFR